MLATLANSAYLSEVLPIPSHLLPEDLAYPLQHLEEVLDPSQDLCKRVAQLTWSAMGRASAHYFKS